MRSTPSAKLSSSMPLAALLAAMTVVTALAAPSLAHADPSQDGVRLRRFALMAGFNDGGPSRPQLRYAATDARAMARVLESLGGVAPADLVFAFDPTRAGLLAAFDRLGRMVADSHVPGVRREVVIYYSGHSDEEGLLIGADRVSYEELRARIQAIPAEVRLAILDSCASGGLTRHKGGVRRPPFLLDSSANTKGHAFLTSSAINEVAQESDRIGASFFTHYLVSGLRGAADVNRDRRVTLQEAFQFAADETLARTEKTVGGPQHAAYEFDLVGTSDLIVTDVRSTQATLVLSPELAGRISVREAGGTLVVELRKAPGHSIELGVEAGRYVVGMAGETGAFEANLTLALGQRAELDHLAFHPASVREATVARGDGPDARPETHTDGAAVGAVVVGAMVPPAPALRSTHLRLELVPLEGDGQYDVHGLAFGFLADRVGRLSSGLQLSLAANFADGDVGGVQTTVGANVAGGALAGAQLAVGGNWAARDVGGIQMAVGANVAAGDVVGAQLAVGLNWAGATFEGAQLAAGINVTRGAGRGTQLAAGLNLASSWVGLQMTSGANLAQKIEGAQIAPLNVAQAVTGTQLGVVNVAGDSSGLQLGVVNYATRSHGFKLGVVNIAREHDGETFGIINLIGDGVHDLAVYATDTMISNVALELGSRHLYTSFALGYNPGDGQAVSGPERFQAGSHRVGFGLGVGYRQPLSYGRLTFLAVEIGEMRVGPHLAFGGSGDPLLASARVVLGIRLAGTLTAIAGIAENVAVAWDGKDLDLGSGFLEDVERSGTTTVRMYPGLLLGLQI